MKAQIETIRATRKNLLTLIHDLSVEELNKIPSGFNNNIIWNLAHLISAQQGIFYKRAGLDIVIEDKFFTPYRPDTKPEHFVNSDEVETIKELLFTTLDRFKSDYDSNRFENYHTWTTRYGVELKSIDDALHFLPFHEGMHCGYIMALKRVIKQK